MRSSVMASSSSTGSAARRTNRSGSAGSSSELTIRATPPPTSASTKRAPENPCPAGCSTAIRTPGDRGLGGEDLAAAQEDGGRHRQQHDERQRPRPGPGQQDEPVGDGDPDRDAERQLDRPPAPLADRDPQGDDRRHGREEGPLVPDHLRGDEIRDGRGGRRLHQRAPRHHQPLEARAHRCPRALGRFLEQRAPALGESEWFIRHAHDGGKDGRTRRVSNRRVEGESWPV